MVAETGADAVGVASVGCWGEAQGAAAVEEMLVEEAEAVVESPPVAQEEAAAVGMLVVALGAQAAQVGAMEVVG
eukprot:1798941-Prymnesium_polylepis.1